ncbi:MAG: hypothetical protein HGN29_10935 [Asgard group archaeon]|nr:hypothetical protein [Asgard group archaeon]
MHDEQEVIEEVEEEMEEKATISDKIGNGLQRTIKNFRKQFTSFLGNLEEQVQNSNSLSYVNKDKVANALNKFKGKISVKTNESKVNEIQEWAKFVDEAISGDKCIICLQPFEIEKKEKIDVILCPNCSYAGHPDHFIKWLKKKSSCPMCREKLSKSTLEHGFLENKNNELVFSSSLH